MKKTIYILTLISLAFYGIINLIAPVQAENQASYFIKGGCVDRVCIGDSVNEVKQKYAGFSISANDTNSGYYVFDKTGNFLLEFSTKHTLPDKKGVVRYIMTSNPLFKTITGAIKIEDKLSSLISKYGSPEYLSGPNGYMVKFAKWPLNEHFIADKYKITVLVSVSNPIINDLMRNSDSINDKTNIKILYNNPQKTYISAIELYCDEYSNGKPMD